MASAYILPLLDDVPNINEQIYRFGGLSIKDFKDATLENKKLFLKLVQKIFEQNNTLIAESENPVISNLLVKNGMEELTYDELEKNHPQFLKAYIDKIPNPEVETEEFLREQKFYIRTKTEK